MTTHAAIAHLYGDDAYGIDRAVAELARRTGAESGLEGPVERWRTTGRVLAPTPRDESGEDLARRSREARRIAEIGERVATATLFGGGVIVVVDEPLGLVGAKEPVELLRAVLASVAPGNAIAFVDLFDPKRSADRWSGKGPLTGHRRVLHDLVTEAGGRASEHRAPNVSRMPGWIEERARELGLQLAPGAAAELARRLGSDVGESDVDRRFQGRLAVSALERLALLHVDGGPATREDVAALVAEATPPTTWGLLDAIAARQPGRAAALLGPVLETTPEPVVLAQLHARVRQLLDVTDRIAAGESERAIVSATRLNPYVAQKLAGWSSRWTVPELAAALDGLFALDVLVKGADGSVSSEEGRRLAFTLWLTENVGRP